MQVLTFWDKLKDLSEELRGWIFEHYNNPLLWIGIIAVGFLIFRAVYSTLNKD